MSLKRKHSLVDELEGLLKKLTVKKKPKRDVVVDFLTMELGIIDLYSTPADECCNVCIEMVSIRMPKIPCGFCRSLACENCLVNCQVCDIEICETCESIYLDRGLCDNCLQE